MIFPSTMNTTKALLETSSALAINLTRRCLHANRSAVCRIKRPSGGYTREYPTKLVFKDGSTITIRHQLPREIVKLPMLYEDARTEAERKAWQSRRKPVEVIEVKKDDTAVRFDQKQYLSFLKKGVTK